MYFRDTSNSLWPMVNLKLTWPAKLKVESQTVRPFLSYFSSLSNKYGNCWKSFGPAREIVDPESIRAKTESFLWWIFTKDSPCSLITLLEQLKLLSKFFAGSTVLGWQSGFTVCLLASQPQSEMRFGSLKASYLGWSICLGSLASLGNNLVSGDLGDCIGNRLHQMGEASWYSYL